MRAFGRIALTVLGPLVLSLTGERAVAHEWPEERGSAPRAHDGSAPPAVALETSAPVEVEYEATWRGTSFGAYLAPKSDASPNDGAVDVIVHFHAGMLAEKEWRAAGLDAVVVSAAFGMGSGPYEDAFRDPARFGRLLDEVLLSLAKAKQQTKPLRLRRLGVVAFSAGYGAVGKILRQGYADKIDAIVLLDGIHAGYNKDHHPDPRALEPYVAFARAAMDGDKLFVMTHSAIQPPDYASTTETVAALLDTVGVARAPSAELDTAPFPIRPALCAEEGDLHAFGFGGTSAKDHMAHLALTGDVVRAFVAPRWARLLAAERRAEPSQETP